MTTAHCDRSKLTTDNSAYGHSSTSISIRYRPLQRFLEGVGYASAVEFYCAFAWGTGGHSAGDRCEQVPAVVQVISRSGGVLRGIPSLALLFIFIPILHTGFVPSAVALTILAIPPLVINTEAGMRGVDRAVLEAGRGMGMTVWQCYAKCRYPWHCPSYWQASA